ncbi:MAG TPA: hypothetical protein VG755_13740 [Nannocystaceae bacterium]|nr:hypothetical protein [Nannocystaceae bacterium]
MSDEQLAMFSDALAELSEREIARWAPVPDLADVLARARAQDAAAVPESWRGVDDDEVVPLSRRRALTQETIDPGLAMFAGALHDRVEGELRERGLAEIPTPQRRRRNYRVVGAAVLALAAVFVAAFVALPRYLAERDDASVSQAVRTLQRATPPDAWRIAPPAPVQPKTIVTPQPIEVAPSLAPAPLEPNTPRPDRRVVLDGLARDAEAMWRAGDLAGAEKALRKIIAQGGTSSRAELAYGDLFALARQLRGKDGPVAEWRGYLRRFPRGRFAEDARAGLCKHAEAADDARACWADYLRRHPSGSHATEARRWIETPP